MVLEKLGRALHSALKKISKAPYVDEKAVKSLLREIQTALLQADVNVQLALDLCRKIEERALTEKPPPGVSRREHLIGIVYSELSHFLGKQGKVPIKPGKPTVLLLVGLQGSGKTTSAAKLAYFFKKRGYKVAMVCADTFRPGAYLQLQQLGEQIGIPVMGNPSAKDSISLAKSLVDRLRQEGYDLIIVDTAGRHKKERELMEEMKQIADAVKPDHIMLVLDGTIGQLAKEQASAFHQATPIGSIFVTKLDGSAKGGGALSAVSATGAPVSFIGTGEHIEDIEEFSPTKFVARMLGMGDLETLLRKFQEIPQIKKEDLETKLSLGRLNLKDFQEMLEATSKMGPLDKILNLIPGLGLTVPKEQLRLGQDKLKKFKAIIDSMTPEERENPEILNASRIRRIARGSGTSEADVKDLLRHYEATKQLAKSFATGRIPRGPLRKFFKQSMF